MKARLDESYAAAGATHGAIHKKEPRLAVAPQFGFNRAAVLTFDKFVDVFE